MIPTDPGDKKSLLLYQMQDTPLDESPGAILSILKVFERLHIFRRIAKGRCLRARYESIKVVHLENAHGGTFPDVKVLFTLELDDFQTVVIV